MPAPRRSVDAIGDSGAFELSLGEIGVSGLVLDRDQPAIGSQPSSDPDPGVSRQRPDLDGQPASGHRGENHQQSADVGPDGDGRKTGCGCLVHQAGQMVVLGAEHFS